MLLYGEKSMRCSRCGKEIDDLVVTVKQDIQILRKTENGLFENYGTVNGSAFEYLCPDCFDKYVEHLDSLNRDYNGKYLVDMVEIVDEVQYGD